MLRESILSRVALNAEELGETGEAIPILERCLKDFPDSAARPNYLLALSRVLKMDGQESRANELLDELISRYPDSDAARRAPR